MGDQLFAADWNPGTGGGDRASSIMADIQERLAAALEDRYRVKEELGQGGMAVVYLAEDLKHSRLVAIKVLKPGLAATLGPDRFLREIETAAKLSHPNILPLHDSGEADNLLYFVMPYVEGESLRDRLAREGHLPVPDAVRITREVADALHFAHGQGLIHRDIKPENILFQAGHAVVTDFGISKAVSEAGADRLTETGLAVGTLAYMSPEQASGEAELDTRTDVYGLGCMLFEMLTGEVPFKGPNPRAILANKLMGSLPDMRASNISVPATVAEVVATALATDPSERFQTAEDFGQTLEHANTAVVIAADAQQRTRARRLRGLLASAAATLLILAAWWISTVTSGPSVQRLAVLPLTNLLNDPEQTLLVAGAHDAIISELQIAGMGVIARRSVLQYQDTQVPIRVIAEDLDLDAALDGSIYWQGDSVELRMTLVDGDTEESLWSRTYAGNTREVVNLWRSLARDVAAEIGYSLSAEASARLDVTQEVNPEAYDAFWKGMVHWRRLTPQDLNLALQYFEFARDRAPDYALGYAGIAMVWGGRTQMGLISSADAAVHLRPAIEKAEELGGDLWEVRYASALSQGWWAWNWEECVADYQRAFELNPNSPDAHAYYSQILLILQQEEEAIEHIDRALELDPFNTLFRVIHAMDLNFLRRPADAEEVLLEILEMEPEHPMALSTLRTTYHLMGRQEEAIQMWRASYGSGGNPEAAEALDRGYAEGGYSAALTAAAETLVRQAEVRFVPAWQIGTLYTRAGNGEAALDWLERAFEEHGPNLPYLAVDPIFDDIRPDPRFWALLERLELSGYMASSPGGR